MHARPMSLATMWILLAAGAWAADDPFARLPANVHVGISWEKLAGDDSRWLDAARAVLGSTFWRDFAEGEPPAEVRSAAELIRTVARGAGCVGVRLRGEAAPEFGVVLMLGDKAADAFKQFDGMLRTANSAAEFGTYQAGGVSFSHFVGGENDMFAWALRGSDVLVASTKAMAEAIAKPPAREQSLAGHSEVMACRKRVDGPSAEWHLSAWADLNEMKGLIELLVAEEMAQTPDAPSFKEIEKATGIDAWSSLYFRVEPADGMARLASYLRTKGDSGLNLLYRQPALTDADVALVPRDAYWAQVWNIDLHAAWAEAMQIVEQLHPDVRPQVEAVIAAIRPMLGVSITEELLPAFGDSWALFDAPSHGGMMFSGTVLAGEVKDAALVGAFLDRVTEALGGAAAAGNVRISHKKLERDGRTVHYALIGGLPAPVAPSWTFVGDRVLIGLFPQTLLAAAAQADPKTRKESLLDHPDVREARTKLPKSASALLYVDSGSGARTVHALRQLAFTLAASMSVGTPDEFDLARLGPAPQEIAKVRNMLAVQSSDDEGFYYEARNVDPAAFFLMPDTGVATAALGVSIVLPSLSRARELAKRTVSMSNLRQIGMAMHIYASDNSGKLPAGFDPMVQGGMITREVLTSPRDEPGSISYVWIVPERWTMDQLTKSNPAGTAIAYERLIDDEGTNVLFVDGHVEFVRMERLSEVMRQTYKLFGREADMPPEFRGGGTIPQPVRP